MVHKRFILDLNKKRLFSLLTFALSLFLCTSTSSTLQGLVGKYPTTPSIHGERTLFTSKVEMLASWYASSMPLEERISQLIISGIDGKEELLYEKLDSLPPPGSFLFFAYNIADTPTQVMQFTDKIYKYYTSERNSLAPLLFLDHEGGQVNRLRNVASPLPSAEAIASTVDVSIARNWYALSGRQLNALGFHINLAPIVESYNESNKIFLDTRSYGTAFQVQNYTRQAIQGYKDAGVAVTIKHFPGNTDDDPHYTLPTLQVNKTQLFSEYVYPFRMSLFENPEAILLSHVITPVLDPLFPACLSKKTVTGILRNDFKFKGLIVSDDLYMGALSKSGFTPEEAVIAAIDAGVTMIMLSAKDSSSARQSIAQKAISDPAFMYKINQAVTKVIAFKCDQGLLDTSSNIIKNSPLNSIEERISAFQDAYTKGYNVYNDYFGNGG